MRWTFLITAALLLLISCSKPVEEPDTVVVDLPIISAVTPAVATREQKIESAVRCVGADLCYHFLRFDITAVGERTYEVRAKGTYPNPDKRWAICLQAIYYKDTTAQIPVTTAGQYIIKFYNGNTLFEADTVQVN